MIANGVLLLWLVFVYAVPYIIKKLIESAEVGAMIGTVMALAISTGFPLYMLVGAGYLTPAGMIAMLFLPIFLLPGVFVILARYGLNPNSGFILFILVVYAPSSLFMVYMVTLNLLDPFLLFAFIIPPIGYFTLRYRGYFAGIVPSISHALVGLNDFYLGGFALLFVVVFAIVGYLHPPRFRRVREITFTDRFTQSRQDMEIEHLPRKTKPKGFSVVNPEDYSQIPKDAIDPFTHDNIHDIITEGRHIVKCNDCGALYDEEVWEYYGKMCARIGCSNSGV